MPRAALVSGLFVSALVAGVGLNAVAASPSVTFAAYGSAPDAPAQPTITPGNASILVAFAAPGDNGSPITSYSVTCASSNGGVVGSATAASPPVTVGTVTNGKTYACAVSATSGAGTGPASPASAPITVGAPQAPAQPSLLRGNGQIVVTFAAPADNGSPITGYTATCTSTDGGTSGATGLTSPTAAPIVVTGLTNMHTYTCAVTATNAFGTGPPSPASDPAMPVPGAPSSPARPAVVAGNAEIIVTYLEPSDNNSPITRYTATCTSTDGGAAGSGAFVTPDESPSPITVAGLSNGKTYTCNVFATNAIASGAPSPDSAATMPVAVPDPLTPPTVAAGNERITVTFVAPNNNGTAITGFAATCVSSDGGASGTKSLAGSTAAPIVVTDLTNGHTYTCTVTATNAVGTGPSSQGSLPVVPAAAPAAPTLTSVTSGNGSLTIAFSANSDNGRPIIGFTAACTASPGGTAIAASGSGSPLTVRPLKNGTRYACEVTASNAIGVSAASAASQAVVVGEPGAPSILPVVSGPAPRLTGSLKVSFHPGAANASAIMLFRATCTPVASGVTRSNTGTSSPIIVSNLLSGHAYNCVVTETNFYGTSISSARKRATVGTPAPPQVQVRRLPRGLSFAVAAPAANGHPVTNYRVRCTSTDGGAPNGRVQSRSPIVVSNLTAARSYICLVTAFNVRGESPPRTVGPVVISH